MRRSAVAVIVGLAFVAGFLTQVLYRRWNTSAVRQEIVLATSDATAPVAAPPYPVSYAPLTPEPAARESLADVPSVVARDIEKIRALTGKQARVHGRVFRVGHSAKSNTYFLNFGPSREALTAVIFSSAVELFEKNKQPPRIFENRDVEIIGTIKDHPQYGLEIVIETPKQIKLLK